MEQQQNTAEQNTPQTVTMDADKEQLINHSEDSLLECAGHQHQLSQPLRGPSLENLVDLGISIRDDDDSTEKNALTGIDFRNEGSLTQDHRLDDLKEHRRPVENRSDYESTYLKIVDQSSAETIAKSSAAGSLAFSSDAGYHEHRHDERMSASVSSFNRREDPSGSYSTWDSTYMNTPARAPSTGIAPTLTDGKKYHVFFSYEISDRDWVIEVVQKLESPELGFRCSMHERDFHPGKRITENITEHIRDSEKTVLVLSPDFIQSQWCRFEIELGMVLSMEESQLLLVPVMVKTCDVPDTIKTLTYIDATTENEWWQRFLAVVTTKDILLADVAGSKDFSIQPRFGNMDVLTEISSNFKCCSGEAIRTPYIPDVLMRPGIQISVEDFDQAFTSIHSHSRFVCPHCCDITGLCLILAMALFSFVMIYEGIVNGDPRLNATADVIYILFPLLWLLMGVSFFLQRLWRMSRMKQAVKEANKVFLKNNVILGFKSEISTCILFRMKRSLISPLIPMFLIQRKLHYKFIPSDRPVMNKKSFHVLLLVFQLIFWYYNISECQKQLTAFLQTVRGCHTNADFQQICQTRASMLISKHSGEYTAAYMAGKLKPKHGTRHVRNASCICQFIEEKYAGKNIPENNIIC